MRSQRFRCSCRCAQAIRANVLLARLDRASDDKADVMQSARAYFELAQLTIRPPAPKLVAVGGLSGTGKSVLARALAPGCHAVAGSCRVTVGRPAKAAISAQ